MSPSLLGRRRWTADEIDELHLYAEKWRGHDDRVRKLALRFGRTEVAVSKKLRAIGSDAEISGYWTISDIAKLIGVTRESVGYWIEHGQFVRNVKPHAVGSVAYQIKPEDVWDWLTDMRSWHKWEPQNLTEREWRLHFTELRRNWLRPEEAAKALFMSRTGLNHLMRRQVIPRQRTNRYAVWLHADDIHAYRQARSAE